MNEFILLCILIICLLSIYFTNKYLHTKGLTIIITVSSILSLILSFKYITISNLSFNSNVILYASMFISLSLLLEEGKQKEVQKITNLVFLLNIVSAIIIYLMTIYTQSLNDTISINMKNVFNDNYKILIVYPITMWIFQKLSITVYEKIKNIYDNLFISSTTTYLSVGLIESIIFITLCYYNSLNNQTIIRLILSNYMVRLIITVIYSLFLTIPQSKKKVIK